MIRHASAEKMAMFRAGELRPRQAARIQAHLARCARCAQTSAGLAAVTTLLASTKAPPIPEHLAARIHSALAAEAAQRIMPAEADGHSAPADGISVPVVPAVPAVPGDGRAAPAREPRVRRPRLANLATPVRLRVAAAAAAVAVVAGGGYALVSQLGSGATGAASSSAASGRKAVRTRPGAVPAAGTAKGPQSSMRAAGTGVFGPAMHYRRGGHRATFIPIASSTNFQPGTLAAQVNAAISATHRLKASGHAAHSTNATASPKPAGAFAGPRAAQLRACVGKIAAGSTVVLVDVARFHGSPAIVIVTEPAQAGRVGVLMRQIYVVGPACSATRPHVLDHVSVPAG